MNQSHSPQYGQRPEGDRVQWPSLSSYLGAFRRHFFLALLFSLPVLALVLVGLSMWPAEYSSTTLVLFDPNQTRGEQQESSLVLANRIASTYTARFQDPEFMQRLAKVLGDQGYPLAGYGEPPLKEILEKVLPAHLRPAAWSLTPEEAASRAQIEALTEQIKAEAVASQFQLSLVAKSDEPAAAQLLAREAMNLFIVEELSKTKARMQAQLRQLTSLEASTLREKNAPAEMGRTEPVADRGRASAAERRELKSREQDLITTILGRQAELTRAQSNQIDRQFELDSELNNLLSRKGPSHPDVIQKRREMEKFRGDPAIARMEADLNVLRKQLYQVQSEMRQKQIPIDRSVQISGFSDEVRRYLLDVSNQIRNLELEVNTLEEQIRNPLKRTRYTTLREPELPTQPSNKKKFFAAAGVGMMLVVGTFFMVIIVREVFSPTLQDKNSFQSRYELPVVAEVKSNWLKKHGRLTSGEIRKSRARLAELAKKPRPELLMLDGYRYLQQYLFRAEPEPQVVFILDVTQEAKGDYLASNLANVMATDSSERVFLLSFRPDSAEGRPQSGSLMGFLTGKGDWKECCIKADESFAYDAAVAREGGEGLGSFRADMVQKLIKALREKYPRIIVEGYGPQFIHENGILCKEADAAVLQVGLGKTRSSDLDRLLQLENPAKIKAVILRT